MHTDDILTVLTRLAQAYPDKRLQEDTLEIYRQELADIPTPILAQAASQHIRLSSWFPRVSELRIAAQQFAGTSQFASLLPTGVDSLALQARKLEIDYFHQGVFDINDWDQLASQLERVGRHHRAAELRIKSRHIQESLLAAQRGEEYPSPEAYLRYAQWENLP